MQSEMGIFMIENIGRIKLDYEFYPGEDLYSDGEIEDELLEIAKEYPQEEFERIIEERASWPILYHLSPLRENIVEWIPMTKKDKVLEVGSGCGAITGALARKAGRVDCIDLSKKRSLVNACRHKEADNVTIHVGNFQDIEKTLDCDYDYILLIGVFEYAQGYIGTDRPYERFMEILKKHLKENGKEGRLVIAIENKFGLKYWAGCKEDHQGRYFSGLEDYPENTGVRTFTRKGLEKICQANGCQEYSFYYPYPDYKFMSRVYSDEYLPKQGELCENIRNFDRSRLLLFDEKNVFDTIIKEELFPLYSNSYLLIVGKPLPVKYSKYSNDRAAEYAICTEIRLPKSDAERAVGAGSKTKDKFYIVEKRNLSEKSRGHMQKMKAAYEKLKEECREGGLAVNTCMETAEGTLAFEFLEGRCLEEMFDELLDKKDDAGFEALFTEFMKRIKQGAGSGFTNYDVIFSNIFVEGEVWTAIDYEWTFEEEIPVKEVAYRALRCYVIGAAKRKTIEKRIVENVLKLTEEEKKRTEAREELLQKKIAGGRLSIGQVRNLIGNPVLNPLDSRFDNIEESNMNPVQIYTDTGKGFSEEESFLLMERRGAVRRNPDKGRENITFSLAFGKEIKAIRIDPGQEACMVAVETALFNGKPLPLKGRGKFASNGKAFGVGVFAFPKEDPNMTFYVKHLPKQETNIMEVSINIAKLPGSVAERLA